MNSTGTIPSSLVSIDYTKNSDATVSRYKLGPHRQLPHPKRLQALILDSSALSHMRHCGPFSMDLDKMFGFAA